MSDRVAAHFREVAAVLALAADMLEPDSPWPADEVAVVRGRLRRMAENGRVLAMDELG